MQLFSSSGYKFIVGLADNDTQGEKCMNTELLVHDCRRERIGVASALGVGEKRKKNA